VPRKRKPTPAEAAAAALVPGAVVWAYLRVSSEQQADKGLPIAGQREAVERYCTERGYVLAAIYVHEGISARTDQRPEFQRLVEDARSRRPAAIVMWSWSRFSRDQNDAQFYKALLRRDGVDVLTVDEQVPHVNGFEGILEALIHWKDEQENVARGAATKRGQHALARLGYLPAGRLNVPRGYRLVPVDTVIGGRERPAQRIDVDPDTAPLVRRGYELRLAGATMAEVNAACPLYAMADNWGSLFRDPAYKGAYRWGEETIAVPPLVTPEVWQNVYDGLAAGRGGAYPRRKASDYYLSGIVVCGRCGGTMGGFCCDGRTGTRYYYYRCRPCSLFVPRARLEGSVVNLLMDSVLTPRWVADAAERLRVRSGGEQEAREAGLRRHVERLDRIVANLVTAVEEADDVREIAARLRERRDERARVDRELAALSAEALPVSWAHDVEGTRERLRQAIEAGGRRAAKAVVQACVELVTVETATDWRVRLRGE
jgi:DNA invertase Pin-like site-specific DNA recombinase